MPILCNNIFQRAPPSQEICYIDILYITERLANNIMCNISIKSDLLQYGRFVGCYLQECCMWKRNIDCYYLSIIMKI